MLTKKVHDEIGRGNFLPLYLGAGAIGSMTSLTAHVLLKRFNVSSLGASDAISGIVAANLTLHSK